MNKKDSRVDQGSDDFRDCIAPRPTIQKMNELSQNLKLIGLHIFKKKAFKVVYIIHVQYLTCILDIVAFLDQISKIALT